jgi:hypothetical protein
LLCLLLLLLLLLLLSLVAARGSCRYQGNALCQLAAEASGAALAPAQEAEGKQPRSRFVKRCTPPVVK